MNLTIQVKVVFKRNNTVDVQIIRPIAGYRDYDPDLILTEMGKES